MPGHNWAFSVAFPHLFANCSQSGYLESPTEFWQDCFDPTTPELYTFIDGFLEEMARAFPDAVVHIGGDEVGTTCWANSTRIQKWLAEHQPPPPPGSPRMNVSGLYAYFEEKATGIARKHGKTVMAWDDVYQKAPAAVQAGKDIVHAWRSPAIGAAARAASRRGGGRWPDAPTPPLPPPPPNTLHIQTTLHLSLYLCVCALCTYTYLYKCFSWTPEVEKFKLP